MDHFKRHCSWANIGKFFLAASILAGCAPKPSDDSDSSNDGGSNPTAPTYLYVASGLCQAGPNTTLTATTSSNIVYRINSSTGQRESILADYNALPASAGDTPVGISSLDSDYMVVLVERTGARRIEKIPLASPSDRSLLSSDVSALSNTLVRLKASSVGQSFIVSRTNAIAKFGPSGVATAPTFASNNVGGACGTSNAKYSDIISTAQGHVIFANSAASNNRVGAILNTGGANCLAGFNAPTANAYPSALTWIPEASQLIVAYSGASTASMLNSIYVYEVTETSTTLSFDAGTKIYDANEFPGTKDYLLFSVPAMAYDASTGSLYVATSINTTLPITQYAIEKFTYDSSAKSLTRVGSVPFYNYGLDTKCISSLYVQ